MLDLQPLRTATFRHLAVGYWVNEFGNWFGEIALAILVFDRTGSPLATATLFLALRFLPALLAPLATTRIEAIRPRIALPILYVLEAAFFGGMALLTRHFSLPVILVLCALDGMLAITAKALTRGISATWLLKDHLLREGNAILNLGVMTGNAAGPAVAGLVVASQGARTSLLIDAATFLLTAAVVATAAGIRSVADIEAGFSGRLRSGVQVLRNQAAVRRLLLAIAFVMMLGSIAIPIEVVFAKDTLHAGDTGYGFLLGAWGVGMMIGGASFAAITEIPLIRILAVGTMLTVAGYAGLAASPTLAVACGFSALGGLGNGAGWIAAVTAVQERTPVSTQAQLMSVLEGINQVMPALGFVVGGVITAASSPRAAYAVSAAGVAIVLVTIALRPIDRVRLSPVAREADNSVSAQDTLDIHERVHDPDRNSSRMLQELSTAGRTQPVSQG